MKTIGDLKNMKFSKKNSSQIGFDFFVVNFLWDQN